MNKSEFDALCESVTDDEKRQVIELLTGRRPTTPDRAVVDRGPWHGWHTCANCGKLQTVHCQDCGELLPEADDQPRAVVAISDDGKWLVVPASDGIEGWQILRKRFNGYENEWEVWDTGQDAHEVLDHFMRDKHGIGEDN